MSSLRLLVRDPARARRAGLPSECLVHGALGDRRALEEAAAAADLVFHVAGAIKGLSRARFDATNVDGTAALMGTLCEVAPGCRVVHVSSLAAAGPSVDGHCSALPPQQCSPPSDYGASKNRGEIAVEELAAGLSWIVVRPPIVYGPGDAATRMLFRQVALPVAVVPWCPRPLSLVHVSDLVRALVQAAESSAEATHVPIDGPDRLDTDRLAHSLARACGRKVGLLRVPVVALWPAAAACDVVARVRGRPTLLGTDKLRELAASGWVSDPAVARDRIGFAAEIPSSEGLAAVAQAEGLQS